MRHRVDHRTLGRYGSHRRAMLANMAASLFLNGQIQTTVTRAKELRRVAEKLITRARGGWGTPRPRGFGAPGPPAPNLLGWAVRMKDEFLKLLFL